MSELLNKIKSQLPPGYGQEINKPKIYQDEDPSVLVWVKNLDLQQGTSANANETSIDGGYILNGVTLGGKKFAPATPDLEQIQRDYDGAMLNLALMSPEATIPIVNNAQWALDNEKETNRPFHSLSAQSQNLVAEVYAGIRKKDTEAELEPKGIFKFFKKKKGGVK